MNLEQLFCCFYPQFDCWLNLFTFFVYFLLFELLSCPLSWLRKRTENLSQEVFVGKYFRNLRGLQFFFMCWSFPTYKLNCVGGCVTEPPSFESKASIVHTVTVLVQKCCYIAATKNVRWRFLKSLTVFIWRLQYLIFVSVVCPAEQFTLVFLLCYSCTFKKRSWCFMFFLSRWKAVCNERKRKGILG